MFKPNILFCAGTLNARYITLVTHISNYKLLLKLQQRCITSKNNANGHYETNASQAHCLC